jgi:septum formation protein
MPKLILASASPRRAEILLSAGLAFVARPAHIDETRAHGESASEYVARLASEKAKAVYRPGEVVVGADTVVLVGRRIFGKPRNPQDAARMLRALSGREHQVITAVCLLAPSPAGTRSLREPERGTSARPLSEIVKTRVWFRRLTDAEIKDYVASGEPMDKAGAYAIQGLASKFVTRIDGCYFNVVGLPVSRVCEMLKKAGIAVTGR